MRIHTDVATLDTFRTALAAEQEAGRIARTVTFDALSEHRSQSHARGIEVRMSASAKVPGDGRRWGNSGSYGGGYAYAATYDEWGFLLAALYDADPAAVVGTPAHPTYADELDFHIRTGRTYARDLAATIEQFGDPFPYVLSRSKVGRRGYGRSDGDYNPDGSRIPRWIFDQLTDESRTAEWARAFRTGAVR